VLQFRRHAAPDVALLVVVAAVAGAAPGMKHAELQVEPWELHAIMQFVTVEVCANATAAIVAIAVATDRTANPRMTALRMTARLARGA
jgi:hypothetical protein